MNREKVIKGLECCTAELGTHQHQDDFCAVCPYKDKDPENWYCFHKQDLMRDSLALLKAQEPVEPHMDYDGHDVWLCGNCHRKIFHPSHTEADNNEKNYRKFCFHCGRAVKWDG